MKNLYILIIFRIIILTSSTFFLSNIHKTVNFGEGDLFVELENENFTIKSNKYSFDWLKSKSLSFCQTFFQYPIFYAFVSINLNASVHRSVSIIEYENCCEL